MKILVTGHKGYIGSVLVPKLVGAGYDVVGLDSDLFPESQFYPEQKIDEIKKDIRDVTIDDLKGTDAVVHLAALSNDPLGDIDKSLTYEINWKASVHLAELAKACGIERFIFSSSCSVYTHNGDDYLNEESAPSPITDYGWSKMLAESGIKRLADKNFSPVYLRNATVFGNSPKLRLDLVVNKMTADSYLKGVVTVDSNPWRPLVHVEDVAKAIITTLQADVHLIHNETFNVGSNHMNWKVQDIAEIVKKMSTCRVDYKDNPVDKRNYRVDFTKIQNRLGLSLGTQSLANSAFDLWIAYQKHHLSSMDLENGKFVRIAQIKKYLKGLDKDLRWKK